MSESSSGFFQVSLSMSKGTVLTGQRASVGMVYVEPAKSGLQGTCGRGFVLGSHSRALCRCMRPPVPNKDTSTLHYEKETEAESNLLASLNK